VKLILDVMGGDRAPHAPIEGAVKALPDLRAKNTELVLLGDEPQIRALLNRRRLRPLADAIEATKQVANGFKVSIHHTADAIGMEDSIRAIRTKPDATINIGCRLAAEAYAPSAQEQDGAAVPTAFISAGHSGAMMASALLSMGRLPGVERPAIAVKLPSLSPDGCVILDVGANIECKPEHLRDFAVMGALFAQVERTNPELPRVGVLSNGEERSKGTELTRAALALIDPLPCFAPGPEAVGRFMGYAEGKEIFRGNVDVVVTDGFVGNVVLKSVEGLGSAVVTILKREAKSSVFTPLGFLLAAAAFRRLKRKLDYAEYGAAPLLGVAGYAFICHGRSNPRAIKNALLRARTALEQRLVERMEGALRTKGI
jgi:glycerol-3-phosphate acyltransferase PlsX